MQRLNLSLWCLLGLAPAITWAQDGFAYTKVVSALDRLRAQGPPSSFSAEDSDLASPALDLAEVGVTLPASGKVQLALGLRGNEDCDCGQGGRRDVALLATNSGLRGRRSKSESGGCGCGGAEAKDDLAIGGGQLIYLNECILTQEDLHFWSLQQTEYQSHGIVLPNTTAYTDSCDMCEYNQFACNKEETVLREGTCLCVWRVNGADPQTQQMQCGACVEECVGKVKSFEVGKAYNPLQQRGICVRKKTQLHFD